MNPLFGTNAQETDNFTTEQLQDARKTKHKDDDTYFETTEDEVKA
jgi:hypothetical protein